MYTYDYQQSPNYTPASQTKALFGRPRTIELGAGHWWGDPSAGYSHAGVVSTFRNAARQASAHLVISAGKVTQMVNFADTSWCTKNANPYTISIEVDPRIHLGGALAAQIKETLCEAIAKLIIPRYGNLEWRAHKTFTGYDTACNPLDWAGIRARALQIHQAAQAPAFKWVAMDKPRKMIASVNLRIYDLKTGAAVGNTVSAGTVIDFNSKAEKNGVLYLRSVYSTQNSLNNGIKYSELKEVPAPAPEWQRNLKDIPDVKLTVLPAAGTQVIDLNTGKAITPLAKGTVVDIAKETTVGGKRYYISSYSVTNNMPNGLLASELGVPAQPPVNEKPEWLANWKDITDKVMYTRVDAPLVNLITGETIKTVAINTAVEIASATDWHAQPYLITKYSTDAKQAAGFKLADLADKPISNPTQDLETRVSALEKIISVLRPLLAKIGINI